MPRWNRVIGGIAAAACVAGYAGCGLLIDQIGGASSGRPADLEARVRPETRELIRQAWAGIDASRVLDHHTHMLGMGSDGGKAWINPAMQSWLSPMRRIRFDVFMSGARIDDPADADRQYVRRLLELVRTQRPRTRYGLVAFDYFYLEDGTRDLERSEFYMPNETVFELADAHPELFVPIASVHPYRPGAQGELRRAAARGARLIKWLPNAMGIDASDPALDPYYDTMRELGLAILTHVGEEAAVEAAELQELGNPLRFRRPLDRGVPVVMAHCASLGTHQDLDHPGERAASFELFMRLFDDPRYEGLLYGEISALLQVNRIGDALTTLLRRTDLHPRLVNGSDYPLPTIAILMQTGAIERAGYITAAERDALDEIYDYNPLLFDFVAKRTVRAPATGERFAPEVFYQKPFGPGPGEPAPRAW